MPDESDIDLGVTIRSFASEQEVFGRYKLVRPLGRGGMGVVWLAKDSALDREVALKFLPELVAVDPVAIEDLKHETRRSLELTHPNIVRVHDFVQQNELAAISMEYVEGRTLAQLRLDRPNRVFETADISGWTQQMAEALHYAHLQARVVHRDLKPANVMVDSRSRIKLTDFGISATVSDTVTRVSRVASASGTAAYSSPQQLMGEAPSPTDDLYSLGATLYELLSSRPPFYTGNIILQVQTRVPPSIAERRVELNITGMPVPPDWEVAIAACLAKEPKERPASVAELAKRLQISGTFPGAPDLPTSDPASLTSAMTVVSPGPLTAAPPAMPSMADSAEAASISPKETQTQPPSTQAPAPTADPLPAAAGSERAAAPHADPATGGQPESAEKPEPKPALPKPERSKSHPGLWGFAALLLAAVAAGIWLADVPDRIKAKQLLENGREAVDASDWPGAIESLGEALSRRPLDPTIGREFEAAQEIWLNDFKNSLTDKPPTARLAAFEAEDAGVGRQLTGPWAAAFRDLYEDAAAKVRDIELASVRTNIRNALQQADQGNAAAAVNGLNRAAESGLLPNEIEDARQSVARRAVHAGIQRLAAAVKSGNGSEVEAVLKSVSPKGATGNMARAANELLQADSPEKFLRTLDQTGIQVRFDANDSLPPPLALVEAVRDRFADEASTSRFVGDRFAQAASNLLANNLPGLALYAADRARAEGAEVDPRIEQNALRTLTREFAFTVHLPATRRDEPSGAATIPPEQPRNALRSVIDQHTAGWIEMIELPPASGVLAMELATQISPIQTRDNPERENATVRYQSGTRQEPNPEYADAEADLQSARRELRSVETQIEQSVRASNSIGRDIFRGILGVKMRIDRDNARERVIEAERKLRSTPETRQIPVHASEAYQKITHKMTYTAVFRAGINTAGGRRVGPVEWDSEASHETVEITGNASRGVPVRKPTYPKTAQLADTLGNALADNIRDHGDILLAALREGTFLQLDHTHKAAGASQTAITDRRWGLASLWKVSGVEVPQEAELRKAVHEQLGLPD